MKWWCIIALVSLAYISQAQDDAVKKIDTTVFKLDAVNRSQSTKVDSVSKKWNGKANRVLDAITQKQKLAAYNNKIDSSKQILNARLSKVQSRLQKKSDSLRVLNLPTKKIEKQLKNVEKQISGLAAKPEASLKKAEARYSKLTKGANVKIIGLEKGVGIKYEKMQTTVNKSLKDIQDIKIRDKGLKDVTNMKGLPSIPTDLTKNIPSLGSPNANATLPTNSVAIPTIGASPISSPANSTLPNASVIPGANMAIPQIKIPNTSVNLNDVKSGAGELNNLSKEKSEYKKKLSEIKEGKVDSAMVEKTAEEQFNKLKESKKLREQKEAIEKYKQMVQQYRNPDALKKELDKNAKELAFDKLKTEKTRVDQSIKDLNAQKKKYGEVVDLTKKPKQRYNAMRGKPFGERLLPGVGLQIQSGTNFLLDVNPYVGYRFSEKLMVGLGWNERIASNFNKSQYFIYEDHVYGIRSFVQFKIASKLTLRAEIEAMNTLPKRSLVVQDNSKRKWAWSYVVGIKQDFKITKKLNGNAQILYNVYDPQHESPYADRLILRFGFEFPQVRNRKTSGSN